MLEKFGCSVKVATDGRKAVKTFESGGYDIVFMDIHMPEMDGLEASRAIREAEGMKDRTPVVAMTARVMEGDREECLNAGMDDFVAKPIKPQQVKEVLRKYCRNS
ncbi:MAG: response regulator [Planctomycetota bacterium]|nr:response regulator [Planctomycetota bacterium]